MERVVELSPGRRLTVRASRAEDLAAIDALYDRLSTDDLHRRFFSAARPPAAFLARWLERTHDDGFGLVGVVADDSGEQVVAEAGYVGLPDGSGELAVTVDPAWRGWLGHYVLDALVEAAAERGVATLQADVLLENRQMLALLDARGFATVDHPDWNTVRVVVGTTGRVPEWPGPHERPRVLVEVPGGRWHAQAELAEAGYQVLACPGPRRGPGGRCPHLDGEPCPLADGADAIVVSLALDEAGRAIVAEHRRQHPGTPVCLSSIRRDEIEAASDEVDAVVPTSRDLGPLLATLERLTDGPSTPAAPTTGEG
ncbi:MAG: N-acetyltransferase family protein [Acidimicrobiales bacterium]